MRIIVVTPVAAPSVQFLPALADSFRDGMDGLPSDVDVTWRLQVDGTEELVAERVRATTVTYPADWTVGWVGRQRGAAYTRTVGLLDEVSRLPGGVQSDDVVVTIDADDAWLPGGLGRLVQPLRDDLSVGWVAAGHLWVDEIGNVTDKHEPLEGLDGRVAPRSVRAAWESAERFPFAASCVAYRMSAVLERGGWPASPSGEDAVLLLGVSDHYAGYVITEPLFVYRQHPEQSTRSPQHRQMRPLTALLMRAMDVQADSRPEPA